jgi:murein DD-endopeptidase MepM/ murein hydrolase activator NlpD
MAGLATALFALGAADVACAAGTERSCHQAVCLLVTTEEQQVRFEIESASAAPLRVLLEPRDLDNMASDPPPPIERWLEPLAAGEAPARAPLATLRVVDPARTRTYRYGWRFFLGAPDATHDESASYRIPFGGDAPRLVGQGANGKFSHKGRVAFAFDFNMPEGVPVLAARDGVVVEVADGSTQGGPSKGMQGKENRVNVLHADGTFGEYIHLRKGIAVVVGQLVRAGDVLGASGNTGYSTEPHLHFHVWRRAADGDRDTVPFRFDDGGDGFVPVQGSYYPPQAEQRSAR